MIKAFDFPIHPIYYFPRYNLDYAKEWAREQEAIKAEHEKMMKRFKPEKVQAKPTKKAGG